MNVIIFTQSYYVRNTFVNALIPKGITLYHAERAEDLVSKALSQKAEIVVLDLIQEDYTTVFGLVKEIKSHPVEQIRKMGIMVLIGGMDKQFIAAAIQIGVIGFIKSNASEDFISGYIAQIYQKIKGIPPERKFVRVSIDERIGVKFRSPVNSQLIIGLIKDISFGGIAVELVGTFPPESLSPGMEVKNIQFILDSKDIFTDAVVVAFQKNFCAFRFTDMSNQVIENISHYIFQRISAEPKEEVIDRTQPVPNVPIAPEVSAKVPEVQKATDAPASIPEVKPDAVPTEKKA